MARMAFCALWTAAAVLVGAASAQAGDLDAATGRWIGYDYSCFDDAGRRVFLDQAVEITRAGAVLTATKIDGDACVGPGEVTWTAKIDAATIEFGVAYPAASRFGAPDGRRVWAEGLITFVTADEIHWIVPNSAQPRPIVFRRPTTEEPTS